MFWRLGTMTDCGWCATRSPWDPSEGATPGSLAPAARAPVGGSQADQPALLRLSHDDLFALLFCHAHQALANGQRLLIGRQPDLEDGVAIGQPREHAGELTLLGQPFPRPRAQLPLGCATLGFVELGDIDLSYPYHSCLPFLHRSGEQ
jgi:hypothetical protein